MNGAKRVVPFLILVCSCATSGSPKPNPPDNGASTRGAASDDPVVATATPTYLDPNRAIELRVSDLLSRMTLQEKVEMVSGAGWMESHAIERLHIPSIRMVDGPMGVRNWIGSSAITNATPNAVFGTAFPSGIGMAATWDAELVRRVGGAIAQQAKALGRDMLLGPTVNIHRTPLWGRNFEGYGEDPYLSARLAVAYVRGVQSEGVIATVKHFAANNQEFERHRVNARVDRRALHEIYFPAFKSAVQEAHVWSVMAAYNKLNGSYCAESAFLLSDVLRKTWGFEGFVISDWGGTYGTARTLRAGTDLEMPGGEPMRRWSATDEFRAEGRGSGWLTPEKVTAAIASREVEQVTLDESVGRILRVVFASGLFDRARSKSVPARIPEVESKEHRELAATAAVRGIVLLKNEKTALPIDRGTIRSLAVVGPNAAEARPGGGGSSQVRPRYTVSPLEGIKELAGAALRVGHARGSLMPDDAGEHASKAPNQLLAEAVALAKASDAAVVVVGNSPKLESEGFDRKTLSLPDGQDALIEAVSRVNPRTIVVVMAGAPVDMTRWIDRAPAVLFAWYAGQESGHAVARVLFGDENPSGRLPVSFPKRIEDSTAYGNYPGENLEVDYAEGIYVGYRGYDKRKIDPLFPFGFGQSYTHFAYANLKLDRATVRRGQSVTATVDVRNTGQREGRECVQLYLRDIESRLDRPVKELKGFQQVTLLPNETKTVSFVLDEAAMSYFDPALMQWVAEPGLFEVLVGASSRDIRLTSSYRLETNR